jgi:hypothetical protein
MQARQIGRPNPSSQARLQLVLIALAAWNLLGFAIQLANARLIEIDGIDGVLGGRAVSGSAAVLAIAYIYAARNPIRNRVILWLASIEQIVAVFAMTFHLARADVRFGEAVIPMIVAVVFLVLLTMYLPRQTDTI